MYSMTVLICSRLAVSQNDTEEPMAAAMNISLLVRAMDVGSSLLWMYHFESVVPVDTSTWWM